MINKNDFIKSIKKNLTPSPIVKLGMGIAKSPVVKEAVKKFFPKSKFQVELPKEKVLPKETIAPSNTATHFPPPVPKPAELRNKSMLKNLPPVPPTPSELKNRKYGNK